MILARIVGAALISTLLGGCALPAVTGLAGAGLGVGLGAGVVSFLATATVVKQTVDSGLELAKPVTTLVCYFERYKAHSPAVTAGIDAFCDNLPDDLTGVLRQGAAVYEAVELERAAARGDPRVEP